MNDEINRNILMTKTILWKAVIHLKRRDTFLIEVINRLNGLKV